MPSTRSATATTVKSGAKPGASPAAMTSKGASGRPLDSLESLFKLELSTLLACKQQCAGMLLDLASQARHPIARQALRTLGVITLLHHNRLETLAQEHSDLPEPIESKALKGGVKAASEALKKQEDEMSALSVMNAVQRIVHADIASLGTAAAHAHEVGQTQAAQVLSAMVDEAYRADRRLTRLCAEITEEGGGFESERRKAGRETDLESELLHFLQRRHDMPNYGYRDEDEGNRRGGGGGSSSGYSRRSQSRYDEDDDDRGRFGGDEGRSRGGRHSAEMQERDEYGQFAGSGGGGRGGRSRRDDDDDDRGGSSSGSSSSRRSSRYDDDDDDRGYRRGGRSEERFGGEEGRSRGGRHSAEMQERDEYGQFIGYGGGGSRGGRSRRDDDDDDRNGGGSYSSRRGSRYDEDDDERGGSSGGSSRRRSSSRYDDDDRGGSSRGERGGYTDSAGRHYTRESWERAQEGRSLGGQHSGGGRGR